MNREHSAPGLECPDPRDLSAFNRGRLPLDKLESIAEHLSGCVRCESSLQALPNEDTILSHLRRDPPELPVVDESACVQLAGRARAIALEQTSTLTMPHATAACVRAGPRLPAVFGAYLLLEQLGQGGMGIVYKAQQQSLKRPVALKLVRAGVYASGEERARFQREGEAIARIRHPHVVQIHEFSESDGQLFFSMELLEGGTLADKLNGQPLPPRQAAELVRTLAGAVHAAHQQGVVHRDLKPGNVLFASDGTVKITDFGLAKVLDGGDSDTQSDAILGTPAYMAPEQARGEVRAVGPLADVYALGAILYETLTGRPPFRAETRLQTLELVRLREPEPPARRRPDLPRDLEAICLKCLEKEPARRYSSAAELAEELDRWLRGEPTRVRPPGLLGRGGRLVRRRPRASAAVLLAVLLPLIGLAVWYWFDPERPVRAIERRLAQGEKVALIGASGGPRWSRWGLRQGVTNPMRQEEGVFSISGLDSTVLTILLDPRRSYRFSAEVRHEHATPGGEVGLAFAHSQYDTFRGREHCLCTLTFNDREASVRDPDTGQMASRINLKVRSLSESGPDRVGQTFYKPFVPAEANNREDNPWRALAVEVRPQGIDLFWQTEHLVHLSHEQILEEFQKTKQELVGNRMVDPLPDLHPAFSPRDALGLFVLRSQASFRRVEVTPLSEP